MQFQVFPNSNDFWALPDKSNQTLQFLGLPELKEFMTLFNSYLEEFMTLHNQIYSNNVIWGAS